MKRFLPIAFALLFCGQATFAAPTPVAGGSGSGDVTEAELTAALGTKADLTHTHSESDVLNLESDLLAKASLVPNPQTVDYTLTSSDQSKVVAVNAATGKTITVPLNATVAFPVGTRIWTRQDGAGAVSVAATGGVTITQKSGTLVIGVSGHYGCLYKTATDTWEYTVQVLDNSTTTDPTTSSDASLGYQVGSVWRNTSRGTLWYCYSNTASAAGWTQINPAATRLGSHASPDTSAGSITWSAPVYEVFTNTTTTYALPAAAGYDGRAVIFYVTGTNAITIDPNASEVIVRDGTAQTGGVTITLTGVAGNYVCLICDGTRWVTLGYKGTLAQGS